MGADHSTVSLIPYEAAKQRKAVLKSLFSRRAVLNLQGLVRRKVDHLVQVLQQRNEAGQSSDLLMAFRCMALDAATDFCFGTTLDALDAPGFRAPLLVAMDAALPGFAVMKHFPLLRKVALHLPPWLVGALYPDLVGLPRTQQMLRKQVASVIAQPEILQAKPHLTVYHRLLDPEAQNFTSANAAAAAASREAVLFDEANTLMFEATHTVADPTMFGLFHILSSPALHARLLAEVRTVWPDASSPAPHLEVLETLPLLTATIKESLRMAPGIASPLYRVTPAEGAVIDGRAVPAGATVGMSIYHVHHNGSLFANPEHFDPDRWLHSSENNEKKELMTEGPSGLDQWFVAFSRGPRSCPGSNLAWCEMYILLSTMLRTFDLRLDRTTANDLAWRDCLVPYFTGRHLHAWCLPSKD